MGGTEGVGGDATATTNGGPEAGRGGAEPELAASRDACCGGGRGRRGLVRDADVQPGRPASGDWAASSRGPPRLLQGLVLGPERRRVCGRARVCACVRVCLRLCASARVRLCARMPVSASGPLAVQVRGDRTRWGPASALPVDGAPGAPGGARLARCASHRLSVPSGACPLARGSWRVPA